ncbi:MAG: hypothetical protein WCG47_12345 [Dermatophilaceae bacterium]
MLTDDPAPAEHVIAVSRSACGTVVLDGVPLSPEPDLAAAVLIAAIDRILLGATTCLTIHAAAMAGPRSAAIVPGVSGTGKSTLAAAAMQRGLRLVSDEAACLDPHLNVLWPHPRPLGLDQSSRTLLGLPAPTQGPVDGERATAPALLGPTVPTDQTVPVTLIVLPFRRPGCAAPGLTEISRADGLAALLGNCLNIGATAAWTPQQAWARLGALIAATQVLRMDYDTPQQGSVLLTQALT